MSLRNSRAAREAGLFAIVTIGLVALLGVSDCGAATLPGDWQNEQRFEVSETGLIKLSLPVETLDKARPGLEDLRLYDDSGAEVPYYIERPVAVNRTHLAAKSFQVALGSSATVITIETGVDRPVDSLTLESPAGNFLKSIVLEGSADGKRWQTLARGQPIFRESSVASQLQIGFSPGTWKTLRITVDDQRSQPVPFTSASVHTASGEAAAAESVEATIRDRGESPGETRLTVDLGAANLDVSSIEVQTSEALFKRYVSVSVPSVTDGVIRDQLLAGGTIYRVEVDGQPVSSRLNLVVESQARARELRLLIRNFDSPPLPIKAIRVERHPVYLVFLPKGAGVHHLLTGNSRCEAPRYDLPALSANFRKAPVRALKVSPVTPNPNYRAPEVLPGVQDGETAIDVTAWRYRKAIKATNAGAQQIELDVDILAHTQNDLQDLRVVRQGRQLPYILERTSMSRALTPTVTAGQDSKDPKLSRWTLKLPHARLPITRLACVSGTQLFQREVRVYEDTSDNRGEIYRRLLGSTSWKKVPGTANTEFGMALEGQPQTDTLLLETHNGDNPPIKLEKFQVFYPAARILFKAKSEDSLFVYYGNEQAGSPRYDLSLAAGQLLAAEKGAATLGSEEQLKKGAWGEGRTMGKGSVLFWVILAVVVIVLLVIISRLLPKEGN